MEEIIKYAINLLNYRALTKKQLRAKLESNGASIEIQDKTIAYLEQIGALDDQYLQERYIESLKKKGKSSKQIQLLVYQKFGSKLTDAVDEIEQISIAYRKLPRSKSTEAKKQALARRGFSIEKIIHFFESTIEEDSNEEYY